MKPENLLLRRIGAIPADEKLPISRFARELNCSAAVIVSMIEGLIRGGATRPLDGEAESLRRGQPVQPCRAGHG